jgi:hypothetical protein
VTARLHADHRNYSNPRRHLPSFGLGPTGSSGELVNSIAIFNDVGKMVVIGFEIFLELPRFRHVKSSCHDKPKPNTEGSPRLGGAAAL